MSPSLLLNNNTDSLSEVAALNTTLAELQTEYDAYISSSRGIEEELEAGLAEALASSQTSEIERDEALAAAAAARTEVNNGAAALRRIEEELRISRAGFRNGERIIEEREQRCRALEQENEMLTDEALEALERCALLEGEAEEAAERNEAEVRQYREEILALKGDILHLQSKLAEMESKDTTTLPLDVDGPDVSDLVGTSDALADFNDWITKNIVKKFGFTKVTCCLGI
uniref:Uncharacterized protein n=1 Tax=Corethron hystrix TaxID=216773 RepID=A0A7S1BWD8_9STRA|mmetsp:Transcript_41238/g.96709  ORF Transcript_41238/g.96709 Transcript_41238/m.96709 type:complete len:229 (+) Transcript_41238:372-1058(+)|eukprot:CAMPEP_0113318010 /NCGR_PEP_ID=MMETSP0010_2-20120614/12726_1 /TAXON_ID=216773 ORGANISM="Corethron hystrix, Strain 308" /NCGR_SAMPLE_ID=MMETSP0010_2 /ASSEMBLY_ACC=CAM_ASM_000155 /LENGTH=228 /DNA_ID=CAMNT_0000175179 /DNA_START=277 /DNA_END=963 /DNA_ORIENTATION=- /assembly_acc=CAM_ASM_000155